MEIITLTNWDEFEQQLRILEEERSPITSTSHLFRGHGDAKWLLNTTLDRFFSKKVSLSRYYAFAWLAKSRLEAFTGTRWKVPSRDEYDEWLSTCGGGCQLHGYKAYDYLAYLRHHGFPSPLLDWSQSPYVAAFFAFRELIPGATHVAVYAYQQSPGGGIISSSDISIIHQLGPYVSAHKRHFMQQSQYTVCTEVDDHGLINYTSHENVVKLANPNQDLMWKFLIPIGERRKALLRLNRMNINAFSLFGSEDSLVETIATSDIYVRGRDL
jgi:hypothetical protein